MSTNKKIRKVPDQRKSMEKRNRLMLTYETASFFYPLLKDIGFVNALNGSSAQDQKQIIKSISFHGWCSQAL